MSKMAVEKARSIHRRYHGVSFPLDADWLAETLGCTVKEWPLLHPVQEVKVGRWIGLANHLESGERRYLIAHALGHHQMHRGNQLSFHDWQRVCVAKQEREADEWAAHVLIPEMELAKMKSIAAWDIAEHFGVPEELAQRRVTEFATEGEKARWQAADRE